MWRRIYQRKLLFWIGMYLSIAFGSALQGFTQHQPIYVWTANVVFSLLIVFLWHKFSGYIQEVRGHSLQDKLILVFLFALSNVMLACSAWQSLGYLWLLPVIMVSIGSGIEQSVILFIALLSQNLLLHSASFSARELLIVTFFGFVCIWLLSQELTGRVLSYVGILMLVLESVLQILRHQFMLTSMLQEFKNTPQKILMEYGSIILLFLFVWWYVFYRQHSGKMTETELAKQQELNKKLSLILEADFGLLLRLQEFSRQLFIHSMTISSVSAQAARHMGGNVLLAQAGGLYHEIGRIMGVSNYIDAGVKLAEEYDFPKELTDIIRQHSMRHEKPKSLEAAIVLFTDCIVSTNDYLEKSGQKEGVSTQKLVEGIFQNRLSKGTLSESGLSQQQIDKLRHFYIKQYFNG